MEIQKTIIPLHDSSPYLKRAFISSHVILRFLLQYLSCNDGVLEHAACCTCRLKPRVKLKSIHQCKLSFCLKVPSTPASWKYHTDLHFYSILMYSSEVMISKNRVSLFFAVLGSNKQCKLILLNSVFNRSKKKSGAVLCN